MIDISINEKQLQEMMTYFSSTPEEIEKAVNYATKKAIGRVRKLQVEYAEKEFVNGKKNLNKKIRTRTKAGNGIILASTKPGRIDDFFVSLTKPSHSPNRLKSQISKSTGKKEMETMFWGFYKNKKNLVNLFMRFKKKIHVVRTVSPYQMVSDIDILMIEDEIQEVFNNALEKAIYEGLGR